MVQRSHCPSWPGNDIRLRKMGIRLRNCGLKSDGGGFSSVLVCIAGTPFGFGAHGSTDECSIGADRLVTVKDGCEDPLDDVTDALMEQ